MVYTAAAPVYPLDEANFLRLKSPGPLRTKVAPGALGAGAAYAITVFTDYLRARGKPEAQLDWYGLMAAAGLMLLGGIFWLVGTMSPGERKLVVKRIETYFAQYRREL